MNNKLFFDLDQTMFDTNPSAEDYIMEKYGLNVDLNQHYKNLSTLDIINSQLDSNDKLDFNLFWRDYGDNFLNSIERHENVSPFIGMVDVIKELSKKNSLYIVTARQDIDNSKVIYYLLNKYIKNCITDIHCVWRLNKNKYIPFHKDEYIRTHSGNKIAFFDDHPKEVNSMQKIIPSYLFDPNKIHTKTNGIQKIFSWDQIGKKFL